MTFIREKKINGKQYAYLVKTVYTKRGPRQKVAKYLGKIHEMQCQKVEGHTPKEVMESLLANLGFTKNRVWTKKEYSVSLVTGKVCYKNKKCVLKINHGYLWSSSIKQFLLPTRDPKELAENMLRVGIPFNEETYFHLVKNIEHLGG